MKNKEPTKNLGGRPRKEIDIKMFEGLCKLQCTKDEICGLLEIDEKTLTAWCQRTYGMGFSDIYSKKSATGKMSIRRYQMQLAEQLNPTMLIWLGKQYLGQRDKQEIDATANMNITIKLEPVRRPDNGKDNPSQ